MKKFMAGIALLCAVSFLFGAPKKPKVALPDILDYEGSIAGAEFPKWVNLVMGNYKERDLRKALDIGDEYKIFVIRGHGPNLKYVQTWVDQVNARMEIANQIKTTVANSTQTILEGNSDSDEQEIDEQIEQLTKTLTNITLNGLAKETSYWIQIGKLPIGKKKAKSKDDYEAIEYRYYVVYTMKKDLYEKQLKAALDDIKENDDQTKFLRESLTEELTGKKADDLVITLEIEE